MKKNTMEYTAPEVEAVLVTVEHGFVGSYGDPGEAGDGYGENLFPDEL